MLTSIATVSISGTLTEKLPAISAAGFRGIEIFEQDFLTSNLSPVEVGEMVRDHGLAITVFQPFRDFEGLPDALQKRAMARAERKFELMNQLGTDLMLVCSSVHPAALGGIDRMAADFHELGRLAERHGVRVAYEALAWGRHVNDHRDAWEIVRRADHANIGLALDSFHTLGRQLPTETIRAIPGDRIFIVQLADAPVIPMDLLYWSRHFRNMPGEGDLDVVTFMRAVAATGYSGPLSLEIFNDQFRSGSPARVAVDGHRSLVQLMDAVRRAEPTLAIDLDAFPPPEEVNGFAFIEFATSAEAEAEMGKLLTSAGFKRTARHVSKCVDRWQQGAINILVNGEPTGFSAEAVRLHGTSVSELAFNVPDAERAAARARAMGVSMFSQSVKDGELGLPAIRGVGGSLIRLVDDGPVLSRIWSSDFCEAEASGWGAGLTGIDHVAQSMVHDELLSWSLFYHALFRAARTPIVDVVDPDGLVQSQAIESGRLRLTLNSSASPHTLASRFVERGAGSSIHHIAFACDDIFATAHALSEAGFAILEIGSNYYSDVEARFELSPDFLARLQACNILYDEDGEGRFYQLYSRAIPEGLFFEIVERRHGYAGYGAANAPFRIAAQKRADKIINLKERT